MTTPEAFIADIIAHPDDDSVRLIYADWLEEHDEPDRAEFIRVQIELAELTRDYGDFRDGSFLTGRPLVFPRKRILELSQRERTLLRENGHAFKWLGHWYEKALATYEFATFPGSSTVCYQRTSQVKRGWTVEFNCGFPEKFSTPLVNWINNCQFVVAQEPVRLVTLTDRQAVGINALGVFRWYREGAFAFGTSSSRTNSLPSRIFEMLMGFSSITDRWKDWQTAEEAASAASRALIELGRGFASLRKLQGVLINESDNEED